MLSSYLNYLVGKMGSSIDSDYLQQLEQAWERWKGPDKATIWDEDDNADEFVRTQTLKGGNVMS